jgi:hypothetical protein
VEGLRAQGARSLEAAAESATGSVFLWTYAEAREAIDGTLDPWAALSFLPSASAMVLEHGPIPEDLRSAKMRQMPQATAFHPA